MKNIYPPANRGQLIVWDYLASFPFADTDRQILQIPAGLCRRLILSIMKLYLPRLRDGSIALMMPTGGLNNGMEKTVGSESFDYEIVPLDLLQFVGLLLMNKLHGYSS